MKKILISIILILILFLVACQNVDEQNNIPAQSDSNVENDQAVVGNTSNEIDKTVAEEPLPNRSIEINSIGKLNEMRDMLLCDNEAQLEQYIQNTADSGIQSKDDLSAFVKIIDSLPQISILDGDITWIRFSHSVSEDTGKETNVVYITTEDKNGDWTRIEYVLSVIDVSKKISDEKILVSENSILNSPIKNSDGNLTLHMETREPHPSGKGTMIQWIGEVDEIFVRIYYFTNAPEKVNTEDLFNDLQTANISK